MRHPAHFWRSCNAIGCGAKMRLRCARHRLRVKQSTNKDGGSSTQRERCTPVSLWRHPAPYWNAALQIERSSLAGSVLSEKASRLSPIPVPDSRPRFPEASLRRSWALDYADESGGARHRLAIQIV